MKSGEIHRLERMLMTLENCYLLHFQAVIVVVDVVVAQQQHESSCHLAKSASFAMVRNKNHNQKPNQTERERE